LWRATSRAKSLPCGYQAVNAMLLNEFLKEHRKVEELEKQVEKLTEGIAEGERRSRDEPPDAESGRLTKH